MLRGLAAVFRRGRENLMERKIFSLDVTWDGSRLVAHTDFYRGFEELIGTLHPQGHRFTIVCAELEDLTPFELGVWLANACRDLTQAWEYEGDLAQNLFTLDERTRADD